MGRIMGLCGDVFGRIYNVFSTPEIVVTQKMVKCPGCGKEFYVDIQVEKNGTDVKFDVNPWDTKTNG